MSMIFLEQNKVYVKNEDNLVYSVKTIEMYDGYNSIHLNLELVAGWDYVSPDTSDIQGWCPPNRFVEDVQSEIVTQFFFSEGMYQALEADGYTVLGTLDDIKDSTLKHFIKTNMGEA